MKKLNQSKTMFLVVSTAYIIGVAILQFSFRDQINESISMNVAFGFATAVAMICTYKLWKEK